MPTILGLLESVLYVEDMHRSVEFYRRVFGFSVLHDSERLSALRVAPGQVLVIIKQGADAKPTVLPFGTIPPSDGKGDLHVAFGIRPDELDQWREKLERTGSTSRVSSSGRREATASISVTRITTASR